MDSETPFDKAKKKCSDFAWNLLSSIQVYRVSMQLDTRDFDDKEAATYEQLLSNHCKYLANEVEQ